MTWQKKLVKELLLFTLIGIGSFLFCCVIAFVTEQSITAYKYLYAKEKTVFMLTIGFIYFIRLSAWWTR